jgi:hypothetical protein
MVQRVLVDKTIEVLRQRTGHFGRATGSGAIGEPLDPLMGKAMDPFTQRRIGKVECVRDRLEAATLDDGAHGLSPPEHTGLLGLFQEAIYSGQGLLGKVEFEGPHKGISRKKYYKKLQKVYITLCE